MDSSLVLTGLSHGKHKFSLAYPEVEGKKLCIAKCNCGYEVEIINFHNYGGVKDLQMKWEKHIGTWKGWVQTRFIHGDQLYKFKDWLNFKWITNLLK